MADNVNKTPGQGQQQGQNQQQQGGQTRQAGQQQSGGLHDRDQSRQGVGQQDQKSSNIDMNEDEDEGTV